MNNQFYKDLIGYKVNIATKGGAESFVGQVSAVLDDYKWLELVPFNTESVEKKFKEATGNQDVSVTSIVAPILKRIDTIETIVLLEKPEKSK
jgi:small nuclear ribonucleoprotein (snRNP)-like protein